MRRLLSWSLALATSGALSACGSSASNPAASSAPIANQPRTAGGASERSCQLDRAMATAESIVVPGTRVRMQLPLVDELLTVRGMSLITHDCGLVIMVIAAPPGPEAPSFLDGASANMRARLDAMGLACREARSSAGETLWACDGETVTMRGRRVETVGGGAVVSVMGPPGDLQAIERIVASATVDPAASYDPLVQMGITLEAPVGMALAAQSATGVLLYQLVGSNGSPTEPTLSWVFVPYEMSERHADGSPWTDRELGELAGGLAVSGDLDTVHHDTLRGGEVAPGVYELAIDAVHHGVPLTLWTWTVRDAHGAFFAVARAPSAEATTWIERWRAHARSLSFQ